MGLTIRLVTFAFACFLSAMSAYPVLGQVINGGYETGNLSGWAASGNGTVNVLTAGNLGSVVPPAGSYMALVSNGPGDAGADGLPDSASLTSASFIVPTGGGVLSFRWNFLTAEFTGLDADPDRLDFFSFTLEPVAGSSITLEIGDVSSLIFSPLPEGSAVSANGTALFEQTGFRTSIFNVSGGTYSLRATVGDGGDGLFDSALALDSVSLSTLQGTSAPEPTTLALLAIGAAVASGRRRRSRS